MLNEQTDTPLDWDQPHQYHGISRNARLRRWQPVLSVQGKQTYLGLFTCAADAARAYDAALWLLRPLTPVDCFPNFQDGYAALARFSAAAKCPVAARRADAQPAGYYDTLAAERATRDKQRDVTNHELGRGARQAFLRALTNARIRMLQDIDSVRAAHWKLPTREENELVAGLLKDLDALSVRFSSARQLFEAPKS